MIPGNIKLLELYAGSRSVGKEAEKLGIEVFSVDIEPFTNIDLVGDIMQLDLAQIPFKPNIIWASPPCPKFSVLRIYQNWNNNKGFYTPKGKAPKEAIAMVKHTIRIIQQLQPDYYFIENPRGMLRKMKFMERLPIRNTVTYCQYGYDYMKPTDIWTNCETWNPKPMCKYGSPCHIAAPTGGASGLQVLPGGSFEKSKIPVELCKEVLLSSLSAIKATA